MRVGAEAALVLPTATTLPCSHSHRVFHQKGEELFLFSFGDLSNDAHVTIIANQGLPEDGSLTSSFFLKKWRDWRLVSLFDDEH